MALILTCLPLYATAQETETLADEFTTAFARYYPTGVADFRQNVTDGLMLLPALEDDWVPAHILFPDGQFDAERITVSCDRMTSLRIAATGDFGFTMTRLRGGEPTQMVTTYSFVGGNTFSRTTDLDGMIADLFPNREEGQPLPVPAISSLSSPMNHGYAILRMASRNIAVIETVGGTPFLLARCP
jgi:hypothetical protein